MFSKIKQISHNIFENSYEIVQVLSFFIIILIWLSFGLIWTCSVICFYKIKEYVSKLPIKFTIFILKIYDKLLTFIKK